jgi:predicted NAD-dependent protein-ADP-ribosyltransferase YbiA (DUF1768 family)
VSRILTFIIITFLYHTTLSAAHIVGGDVTYKCIESNPITKTTTFTVTFTIYRDLNGGGATFDNNAAFGVFQRSMNDNNWSHKETIRSSPIRKEDVLYDDKCVIVPPNIRIEKANYIFDVVLPWGTNVYQITYQRCCRNATLNNIENPDQTGDAFSVEIFGNSIENCNNSPVFNKFPPILICNQKALNFDHSASDSEGDKLQYEFCAPLHAGGTDGATTPGNATSCTGVTPLPINCLPPFAEVVYSAGYSTTNPMGGSPQISIDPTTGIITGTPNLLGQFVVGVCVKEFKNGVQIGSIRRDFQFNVVNCQGISETRNLTFCTGDSINVNGTTYNKAGTYTQVYQTTSGCDSTININIKELKKSESQLYYKLCDDASAVVNGISYSTTGVYTQVLTNKLGCDSTLTITIEKFNKTQSNLSISLCDDETGIVNGIVYDQAGNYSQTLVNANGCDSILNIYVQKGRSSFTEKSFSLCDQNPIIINGKTYNQAGQYYETYSMLSGCDSILAIKILPCDQNILYDLEKCDALVPANSMVYDEFVPAYKKTLDCGQIIASNIYRDNPQVNKHSCTQGFNNSVAMCVGASPACDYAQASATPIVFKFTILPDDGNYIQFNHLIFQQKAPLKYSWIAGATGPNNFPTKYGIKIFKNNVEIFRKTEVSTNNDWTKEKYDFFDNEAFATSDSVVFRVEMTPYCRVGNGATESVWDIDDVTLHFSCHPAENRLISGEIMNPIAELGNTVIRRKHENTLVSAQISSNGTFMLPNNKVDKAYILEGYNNENTIYGLTTLDLVLTQRHILGLEPFSNPLQYLAADVNNDRKITASDLVQMRKILLGIDTHFKNNTSWIFLDETSVANETNPWLMKRYIHIPKGTNNVDGLRFIPVKVGDVDRASHAKINVQK